MKKILLLVSALVALVTLSVWASGGFHTGWTQTSIEVNGVDEFTGIEYTTREDGFVPGVDFLGGGLALAAAIPAVLFGVQFLQKRSAS